MIRNTILTFITLLFFVALNGQDRQYYELRTYHLSSMDQLEAMHEYMENAYLPTLHQHGYQHIGVFVPIDIDTATAKKMFVLTPADDPAELLKISDLMFMDKKNMQMGKDFWMAAHDAPPYDRLEISIIKAFELHPQMHVPSFDTPDSEQIFELRSYEGATERLYRKKVEMFNTGGEIAIFEDLDFNAVFYGEVQIGTHMPNLVYMTSFPNLESRNAHWDAFREAPAWKTLSAKEEYKNTVSHIDLFLLHPAPYSDL